MEEPPGSAWCCGHCAKLRKVVLGTKVLSHFTSKSDQKVAEASSARNGIRAGHERQAFELSSSLQNLYTSIFDCGSIIEVKRLPTMYSGSRANAFYVPVVPLIER